MAEVLKPIADQLPAEAGHSEFEPVARLQQDVSPILVQIYRESGVYLEAVQTLICTIANGTDPESACR